jgi:outer membrane protein TolC
LETKKQLSSSLKSFKLLLNIPLDTPIELADVEESSLTKILPPKERNIEIRSLALKQNELNHQIGALKGQGFPKITASGSYNTINPDKFSTDSKDQRLSGTIIVNWRIFDGFISASKITEMELKKQEITLELEEAKKKHRIEIETLQENLDYLRQMKEVLVNESSLSLRRLEKGRKLLLANMTTLTEVKLLEESHRKNITDILTMDAELLETTLYIMRRSGNG